MTLYESMSHLIAEEAALHFIHHYQRLLVEVVAHPDFPRDVVKEDINYVTFLTQARSWMLQHPQAMEDALAALGQSAPTKSSAQRKNKAQTSHRAEGPLPADVELAVRSMREGRWVYLRDTAQYSILLPMVVQAPPQAYAVKSLTTRLRDMTDTSGMVIQAALMEYAGCILTDGLIGRVAYLGANYCASYSEDVAQARAEGRFYKQQFPVQDIAAAPAVSSVKGAPAKRAPAAKKRSKK